jgi:hypothetical protein
MKSPGARIRQTPVLAPHHEVSMRSIPTDSHGSPRPPIGRHVRRFAFPLAAAWLVAAVLAGPAAAQWTRISQLPASGVFALRVVGDTITAGADTAAFVSTDGGATWHVSVKVAPQVIRVSAVMMRNGRLYAGTAGQGVFISDNLGASWQPFNQGLVGGFQNSQLDISDLELRGSDLLVSTFGAGVYLRNLAIADTWHHFGEEFEPNQASNVNDLALGGTRLLACIISNGVTFHRDPGDLDWTIDFLQNGTISPSLTSDTAIWTGSDWIVGTNQGVFVSPNGEQPWTHSSPTLHGLAWAAFAQHGPTVFAVFDSVNFVLHAQSDDAGATWTILERVFGIVAFRLAVHGNDLYVAQSNGLWVRPLAPTTSVEPPVTAASLHFALAGSQPIGDQLRFRFDLPEPEPVTIEVFDVAGRRAAEPIRGSMPAGRNEIAWDARSLSPGVYLARLTAGHERAVARMIRAQ